MVSLRERKNRPSYAQLFDLGDSEDDEAKGSEGEPGPSTRRKRLPPIEDPVSDSEFDPGEAESAVEGGDVNESDSEILDAEVEDDDMGGPDLELASDNDVLDFSTGPKRIRRREVAPRAKRHAGGFRPPSGVPSGIQTLHITQKRPGNRTSVAVINGPANRTRPRPLYISPKPSLRLSSSPAPFEAPKLQSTPAPIGLVSVRLSKSWANSLNPGPVWQLMEDLAWYKELIDNPDGGRIRPVVYEKLKPPSDNLEMLKREYVVSLFFGLLTS
jgi:transcription factor C subunit 6